MRATVCGQESIKYGWNAGIDGKLRMPKCGCSILATQRPRVHVQQAASCSTNGHLNFNAELPGLDEALWDNVIVHELLHFLVPNHGRLWKSLMQPHPGNYESVEVELVRHG